MLSPRVESPCKQNALSQKIPPVWLVCEGIMELLWRNRAFFVKLIGFQERGMRRHDRRRVNYLNDKSMLPPPGSATGKVKEKLLRSPAFLSIGVSPLLHPQPSAYPRQLSADDSEARRISSISRPNARPLGHISKALPQPTF